MQKILYAALLIAIVNCSCKKTAQQDEIIEKYGIPLTASQVVPATTSTATATVEVIYNKSTKEIKYTVRWEKLSAFPYIVLTGPGNKGENASFLKYTNCPIPNTMNPAINGSCFGSFILDEVKQKEADLLAGKWSVILIADTRIYPNGELKGQIEF